MFGDSSQKPSIEWVNIPAGTFTMVSPIDEIDRSYNETQHEINGSHNLFTTPTINIGTNG